MLLWVLKEFEGTHTSQDFKFQSFGPLIVRSFQNYTPEFNPNQLE